MKIILLEESLREVWDRFVQESDDAWFFHLYDWVKLTEEVWHYESLSFLVENDQGEILAICPLFLVKQRTSWFMPLRYLTTGFGSANPALKLGLGKEYQKKTIISRNISKRNCRPMTDDVT